MSIDIEECEQIANRLQSMEPRPFSVDARAIELFPGMVDELIRYKQRPEQTTIMFSGLDPGDMLRAAQEFEAEEARKKRDKEPPAFVIGDRVKIIGPAIFGGTRDIGKEFTIEEEMSGCLAGFTAPGVYWHPASSLRKIPAQTIGEAQAELQTEIDAGTQAIREILAPLVEDKFRVQNVHNKGFADEIKALRDRLDSLLADYREEKQKRLDLHERLRKIESKIAQFDGEIGSLHASIPECLIESGDVEARSKCRDMDIEKRLAKIEAALHSV